MSGKITKVSGPLVVAGGLIEAGISDIVRIGAQGLLGEILTMTDDSAFIQVYGETDGLGPGAEVYPTGAPLCAELGPGLLEGVFDGIQRPLTSPGIDSPGLDKTREWTFTPLLRAGAEVTGGCVIGTVVENAAVSHKIMIPPGIDGVIESIKGGAFTVDEPVCRVKTTSGSVDVTMLQKWPVRLSRPYKRRLVPSAPLCTGLRAVDTLFPIAKGGAAAVPGPFGSGKTSLLQRLAQWSDVDIVVYIGCGARGNEIPGLMADLSALKDPRCGAPLIKRTVFIASTSDMPVAMHEAAIYTGAAIAEYFRDMGYNVAVLTDSTSRWAEAMREISASLGYPPCEQGYPAYLASRLAQFYDRAGVFESADGEDRLRGSLTIIGAVSPPMGDTSEPVSQATMRFVKAFLELDDSLARSRHLPAVNWLSSYSLYADSLKPWFDSICGPGFMQNRDRALSILGEEASLLETAGIIGYDSLCDEDKLTLEVAKMLRENFLCQDFLDDSDDHSSYEKQYALLELILKYRDCCFNALENGIKDVQSLFDIEAREAINRAKTVHSSEFTEKYKTIGTDMARQISEAANGGDGL